jgi:hypothetical protein
MVCGVANVQWGLRKDNTVLAYDVHDLPYANEQAYEQCVFVDKPHHSVFAWKELVHSWVVLLFNAMLLQQSSNDRVAKCADVATTCTRSVHRCRMPFG